MDMIFELVLSFSSFSLWRMAAKKELVIVHCSASRTRKPAQESSLALTSLCHCLMLAFSLRKLLCLTLFLFCSYSFLFVLFQLVMEYCLGSASDIVEGNTHLM